MLVTLPKIFKKLWPFRRRRESRKVVLITSPRWTKTQKKLVGVHMRISNLHLIRRLGK